MSAFLAVLHTVFHAAALPPTASTTSPSGDSDALRTAYVSLAGAAIGALALIYTSAKKKDERTQALAATVSAPVPVGTSAGAPSLQSVAADQAELEAYFERRRDFIDNRFEEYDQRFDRLERAVLRRDDRIDSLEDRADKSDRRSRRMDEAGSDVRRESDPPDTRVHE